MVHDGTEDRVLSLLESKLESCWALDVGGAPEVFDGVPRDHVEPLEGQDFFIKAEGQTWLARRLLGCCGGFIRARSERQDNLRVSSNLAGNFLNRALISGLLWV